MGLRIHSETKQMPVYALTVAKGGAKFRESDTEGPIATERGPGGLTIRRVSMFELATELSGKMFDRPIVDETGLKGRYDIHLDLAAVANVN